MATPTVFQKKLATIAQTEYNKYRLIRENQEPLASQINKYWIQTVPPFPGVDTAWSAVFVSWCVKAAGASSTQFLFAPMHSQFVKWAIRNTTQGTGSFRGHPVNTYSPKIGDILQNNRGGNSYDFAYAKSHGSYLSHSAVVIEVGSDNAGRYLRTVGGNESDSVGLKEVRLNNQGQVKNPHGVFIAVIETIL